MRSPKQLELTIPRRAGILLERGFSLLELALCGEPLRIANQLSERELYRIVLYGPGESPVPSGDGVPVVPHASIEADDAPHLVVVLGGEERPNPRTQRWLRRQAARKVPILGGRSGTGLMLSAGLMNGYRCAAPAAGAPPGSGAALTEEPIEIDSDRLTCNTPTGVMSLMLHVIGEGAGEELANAVSNELVLDGFRALDEDRLWVEKCRLGRLSPTIGWAISLMESNLETPMSCTELARRLRVSVRQLERVFREHGQSTPMLYYRELRLRHARKLILNTEMDVRQVAKSCGFSGYGYFVRRYRARFGRPPIQERVGASSVGKTYTPRHRRMFV